MGPEPIWGSTSNVPFLGRCRAPGELSQFLKWVAFITVMNALQPNDMGADAVLANDSPRDSSLSMNLLRQHVSFFAVFFHPVFICFPEVFDLDELFRMQFAGV